MTQDAHLEITQGLQLPESSSRGSANLVLRRPPAAAEAANHSAQRASEENEAGDRKANQHAQHANQSHTTTGSARSPGPAGD